MLLIKCGGPIKSLFMRFYHHIMFDCVSIMYPVEPGWVSIKPLLISKHIGAHVDIIRIHEH